MGLECTWIILGIDDSEWATFSVQTISGTGANHLGALFLSRFYSWNGSKKIYLSNPTWGTHRHSLRQSDI